jgi:predicted permease
VTLLSIVLGIGASTALFSIVNALLLKSLPVANPQQLMKLVTANSTESDVVFSFAVFDGVRRQPGPFDGSLAYSCCQRTFMRVAERHEPVDQMFTSDDFFTTLGLQAHLGRLFLPGDDLPAGGAAGPKAVISHALWRRLGGDPEIVGQSVTIDQVRLTVIGVTPPSFLGLEVGRTFDVALPIHAQALLDPAKPLGDHLEFLNVWLRLRPHASLAAATDALRAAQPVVRAAALPPSPPPDWLTEPFALRPEALGSSTLRGQFGKPVLALFGLTVLLLLITCANVANLLLARSIARRHEMCVRLSLGATRSRIVRLIAIESVLLAGAGAIGGLVFARWASDVLTMQLSTAARSVSLDLSVDWRVIGFVMLTVLVTVITSGLAPALRATRVNPAAALADHRRVTGGRAGMLLQWVLVAQVGISLVLAVAAGLFMRTLDRLSNAAWGFDDQAIVVTVTPTTVPAAARNRLYHELVAAVRDTPGVAHAGGSLNPPLIGLMGGGFVVSAPGTPPPADAERIRQFTEITPGWFDSYGTTIRAGRDFTDGDGLDAEPVMMVNDAFVRQILRKDRASDAVDTTLVVTSRFPPLGDMPLGTKRIVGVVEDAVYRSIRETMRPTLYLPLAQRSFPLMYDSFFITVRAEAESPVLLTQQVGTVLTGVNPNLSISYQLVGDQVRDALAQDRVLALLAGFFGVLALVLAGLGLYGVTSYAVTRRRPEIALRLVLGATPASVVRLVLYRLALGISLGIGVGLVASLWASTLIASQLFGIASHDPTTFIAAIVLLASICAFAGLLPAVGVARVDPAGVLREN